MFDPTLVTLLRMRTRHSQSSRENGTSSSGTSPLASYKEVSPPPSYPGATLWNGNLPETKALITVTSWLKSASPKQRKKALKKVLDSWIKCYKEVLLHWGLLKEPVVGLHPALHSNWCDSHHIIFMIMKNLYLFSLFIEVNRIHTKLLAGPSI